VEVAEVLERREESGWERRVCRHSLKPPTWILIPEENGKTIVNFWGVLAKSCLSSKIQLKPSSKVQKL